MRRRAFLRTGTAAGAIALAGCGLDESDGSSDAGTLRIGTPVGLTGPYSAEAEDQRDAVELAADELSNSDDYDIEIKVFTSDTELDPSKAVEQTRRMTQEHNIHAIVGATSSSTGTSLAPLDQQADVVFMSPNGTDLLNGEQCSANTFQMASSSAMTARGIAPLVLNNDRFGEDWFLIVADYGWGHDVQSTLEDIASNNGRNIVGSVRAPFGTSDFSNFLSQAQSADPDTLFLIQYGASNSTAIEQTISQGLHQDMEIVSPLTLITAARAVTQEALSEVWAGANWYHGFDNELSQEFVSSFHDEYGRAPSDLAQTSYKSVQVLVDAYDSAGSLESGDLISELEGYEYELFKETEQIRSCDHLTEQQYFQLEGKSPGDSSGGDDVFEIREITDRGQTTPECSPNCDL